MFISLTIAGADPSSGAGVQADVRTCSYFDVYGISAITCLTIQNSCKIKSLFTIPDSIFKEQLDFLTYDVKPASVKVGMIYGRNKIQHVANYIRVNKLPFVLDPIIESSSGFSIMDESDVTHIKSHLFPLATIITPNIPEAEILTSEKIENMDQMMEAAIKLKGMGPKNVLIKGGHIKGLSSNILFDGENFKKLDWRRYPKAIHGTGCILSAAISAGLAKKFSVEESVVIAHDFMKEATKHTHKIGTGMEMLFNI